MICNYVGADASTIYLVPKWLSTFLVMVIWRILKTGVANHQQPQSFTKSDLENDADSGITFFHGFSFPIGFGAGRRLQFLPTSNGTEPQSEEMDSLYYIGLQRNDG